MFIQSVITPKNMRYYRTERADGGAHLLARHGADVYDLTAANPDVATFEALARAAAIAEESIDTLANRLRDSAPAVEMPSPDQVLLPALPPEIWAAGVTYRISEEAREAESSMPEMYLDVYEAERPELFFKATPDRSVATGDQVGIRGDSQWDVPEPELGIVLYRGEIVGYTIGNDMSSRDIEGQNPLYLPQAKVYDRCCSIGPCIASADAIGDPHDLSMAMSITRNGESVFEGDTRTGEMVRTCNGLVESLRRHNVLPELTILLTGTSIVPPDSFTLEPADRINIEIEGIGELENTVTEV